MICVAEVRERDWIVYPHWLIFLASSLCPVCQHSMSGPGSAHHVRNNRLETRSCLLTAYDICRVRYKVPFLLSRHASPERVTFVKQHTGGIMIMIKTMECETALTHTGQR